MATTKLDLSKTYRIRGESSVLKPKGIRQNGTYKVESIYGTPQLKYLDLNLPTLFLVSNTRKYITFAYYINSTRQIIRFRPNDLQEWQNKEEETKISENDN